MKFFYTLSDLITKHMLLLILCGSLLALWQPTAFSWAVPQIPLLLGVVMFGMGTMLKFDDFYRIFKRPKEVCIGALAQYTIMPLVAWIVIKALDLPEAIALGVLLVGACPGGTASNVITYLARGDVALSVSITMTTTLLSPIITPFLILVLAGETIEVQFLKMMLDIAQIVILPVFLGIITNKFFGKYVTKYIKFLPMISVIAIVVIIAAIMSINRVHILNLGLITGLAVILHNLAGFGLGLFLAKLFKLDSQKTRTIAIEVAMQNSGLAASLAMLHFGSLVAIPGAIFSVWHNISGSIFANYFAKKEAVNH